jgi:hypothetical protein
VSTCILNRYQAIKKGCGLLALELATLKLKHTMLFVSTDNYNNYLRISMHNFLWKNISRHAG